MLWLLAKSTIPLAVNFIVCLAYNPLCKSGTKVHSPFTNLYSMLLFHFGLYVILSLKVINNLLIILCIIHHFFILGTIIHISTGRVSTASSEQ